MAFAKIPIPLWRRWRTFRYQFMPFVIFGMAALGTVYLGARHRGSVNAVGEVFALRTDVASRVDGQLVYLSPPPPRLFEAVIEGQVVARLDDRDAKARLEIVKSETAAARAQLKATIEQVRLDQERRRQDEESEARRLAQWRLESQLDNLDRQTVIASDKLDLRRLEELFKVQNQVYAKRVINKLDFINADLQKQVVERRLERANVALKQSEERLVQITDRLARHAEMAPKLIAEVRTLLAPWNFPWKRQRRS